MRTQNLKFLIAGGLVLSLTSACMPRQAIKYPMDDITTSTNSPFAKAVLAVKIFDDRRKPLRTDCPSMEVSKIEKGEKTFYFNCDNHYKSDSIAQEITNKIKNHLNKSQIFEKVILADVPPSDADYLLTGQITKFEGLKEYKLSAVIAFQFGLVGAFVNLATNSNFEGTTKFDNLELIRTKDKVVIWHGDITGHIEGADPVDTHGWSSYRKANLSLKEANTKLASQLNSLNINAVQANDTKNAVIMETVKTK